jgi:putative SOS response-associated peptidase YedK
MLNARAETIKDKPAFRTAFQRRRCLIPSDGFYEWKSVGKQKQPVHFRMRDGRLFAFAGLWERWTSPDGTTLESCTIITTGANELVLPVHDRMPVILDPSRYNDWLDPRAGGLRRVVAAVGADCPTWCPTWSSRPRRTWPTGAWPSTCGLTATTCSRSRASRASTQPTGVRSWRSAST